VSTYISPEPDGPITYEQWLRTRIAQPGLVCGPDVIDSRRWWEYLPGLNPYADLEAQAREAASPARASAQAEPAAEPEAG
jgi:hypothetical protein